MEVLSIAPQGAIRTISYRKGHDMKPIRSRDSGTSLPKKDSPADGQTHPPPPRRTCSK